MSWTSSRVEPVVAATGAQDFRSALASRVRREPGIPQMRAVGAPLVSGWIPAKEPVKADRRKRAISGAGCAPKEVSSRQRVRSRQRGRRGGSMGEVMGPDPLPPPTDVGMGGRPVGAAEGPEGVIGGGPVFFAGFHLNSNADSRVPSAPSSTRSISCWS